MRSFTLPFHRRTLLLAFAALAVVLAFVARDRLHRAAVESDYQIAKAALAAGRWQQAIELGERLAQSNWRRIEGLLIAGEAHARRSQPEQAIALLAQVPQDGSPLACSARLAQAEVLLQQLGRLGDAESLYSRALDSDPDNVVTLERLAYVRGIQGRTREAADHRLALLRQGRVLPVHLVLLALGDTADENPEAADRFLSAVPDDPAALRARATVERKRQQPAAARRHLESAVRAEPLVWPAQASLANLLLELDDLEAWDQWRRQLPDDHEASSEIWFAFGNRELRIDNRRAAVRCFAESVRLDPNHLAALHQLGRTLKSLGHDDSADFYLARAKKMEHFATAARAFQIAGAEDSVTQASVAAEQLGLAWEAWGWRELARLRHASPAPEDDTQTRLRTLASASPCTRVTTTLDLFRVLRPCEFPFPDHHSKHDRHVDTVASVSAPGPAKVVSKAASRVAASNTTNVATTTNSPSSRQHGPGFHFTDAAAACGIHFSYVNGRGAGVAGEYMYEFSGGAAAVLDYDHDGRPDLYFAQGAAWPPDDKQRTHLDALFRNRVDGRAESVAEQALIVEQGFSQGVAVGDFDNDGFDDLYVANIGGNRLFHNCGDGTFEDVTDRSSTAGNDWSTGAAIADFNGDGHPDLYVANYLTGPHLFDRPCLMPDGSTRLCTPHEFAAAQDRLYLSQGDGRFADVTDESGIVVPDGKTLGLVVADFDDSGRLGVFTANDAVPNFLLVNQTERPGAAPRFLESGLAAGVSVDGEGRAQACMGIAAGDADGDGTIDLFVTNFRNEANTLYLKKGGLDWLDATRSAGLFAPSFEMLGFGAQMLDADLDGDEDLLLVNGHVGDLRQHGVPYAMRPQFFENVGGGKFIERRADRAGPFFASEYVGRGLARLDWNLDGLPDVAVNHLTSPASLVLNQTKTNGRSLRLQLVGTQSPRTPIGATVEVHTDRGVFRKQLLAGDGYMASNERTLIFGFDSATRIDHLEVRWPSGKRTHHPAAADVLVE